MPDHLVISLALETNLGTNSATVSTVASGATLPDHDLQLVIRGTLTYGEVLDRLDALRAALRGRMYGANSRVQVIPS